MGFLTIFSPQITSKNFFNFFETGVLKYSFYTTITGSEDFVPFAQIRLSLSYPGFTVKISFGCELSFLKDTNLFVTTAFTLLSSSAVFLSLFLGAFMTGGGCWPRIPHSVLK